MLVVGVVDQQVVCLLVHRDSAFGQSVLLEALITIEMIGSHVQQHSHARMELRDMLELEGADLQHHYIAGACLEHHLAEGDADVPGDMGITSCMLQDETCQLRRRCLAVGSRDRNDVRSAARRCDLDLVGNLHPLLDRLPDDRRRVGHSGGKDQSRCL